MARRRRTLVLTSTALALLGAGVAIAGDDNADPAQRSLPSGRVLQPQGQAVPLGSFPVGGAVTPDGRFAWAISIMRRTHQLRIVSVERKAAVQTLPLANATGGIAMDPQRARAYLAFSDGVRAYSWNRRSGRARLVGYYPVPRPPGHPGDTPRRAAFAGRLAVAPDGRRLLVPLSLADTAAIVDTRTRRVRNVDAGSHPYGAAILRNGRIGLVSNEGSGTVTAINVRTGARIGDIQVGAKRSHPLSIAVDPRTDRVYVAVAHADQVAVIDTRRMRVERTLSVGRPEGLGTMPVDVTTSRDGAYLLVAEAGADELAAFRLPAPGLKRTRGAFGLIGRIPVADYPVHVGAAAVPLPGCPRPRGLKSPGKRRRVRGPKPPPATTQRCERVVWIAAEGFGSTPNPFGPTPYRTDGANIDQAPSQIVTGFAGVLGFPSDRRIRALTATASAQVRPSNPASPPAGTPLRAGGPIRHVFFIVRENRTYDQVLGDVGRGNGDPQLTLFGDQVTPNIHALVARFPLLDGVRANSETSVDGHLWTTAARVSDYVQRNWIQTYDPDGRPAEVFNSIRWPASGFLFDQADRQGISYFNYGESIAGTVEVPDADLTPTDAAQRAARGPHAGHHAGARHPTSARGAERLRPRASRGSDLSLVHLESDGDLLRGGRLPERCRPRRRPSHPGAGDLPLREAGGRGARALRPAVGDPLDGADPRDATARPHGRARHAHVRRLLAEARQCGALRRPFPDVERARDQSASGRDRAQACASGSAARGLDPTGPARRGAVALGPRPSLETATARSEREPGRVVLAARREAGIGSHR
jgi:hypothetical protein